MDDSEAALRASLAEHARQAPDADALADRIVSEAGWQVGRTDVRVRRRWLTPAIAAAAVAAVAVGIVLVGSLGHDSRHRDVAGPDRATPSVVTVHRTVTPSAGDPSGPAVTAARSAQVLPPDGGPVPTGFQVRDMTFVSGEYGWALGSGLTTGGARETAIVRTEDGGTNWVGLHTPAAATPANTGGCGTGPCISKLRFADILQGYAFGAGSLWYTGDGAASWTRQPGSVQDRIASLEVDGTDVLAVLTDGTVEHTQVGSSDWQAGPNLGSGTGAVAALARTHDSAYYLTAAAPGSTQNVASVLHESGDGGQTWTTEGEPCPAGQGHARYIAAGADQSLVVACERSGSAQDGYVLAVASNGGPVTPVTTLAPGGVRAVAGFAAGQVLSSSGNGLFLNGIRVATDSTSGSASFLGVESATQARWVTGDGSTVWTTSDGGHNWMKHTFI